MSKDPVYSLFATETLIPMVEEAKRVIRNDLVSSCNTYTGLFALPHLITGRTTASYAPIQLDSVMIAHTHGNPFDLKVVKEFCNKHHLWLVG